MVVALRLQRVGRKNQPQYRVVAIDNRRKVKGAPLEVIGLYDPINDNYKLDIEKYESFIKKGAKPSNTVKKLYSKIAKKEKTETEIINAITSKQ